MKLTLLLLLAGLCTLPASAKPLLFSVGSFPPDISAYDKSGKMLHIPSLHGKKRVVLLSTKNAGYQDGVQKHRTQFAGRDIVVLTTDLPSYQFYLVGKDGLIKMARYTPAPERRIVRYH